MTVPHDEQPLTRRALRELERQKPRKQQKEEAKAADGAEAERQAQSAALARSERAAFDAEATAAVSSGGTPVAATDGGAAPEGAAAEASSTTPILSRRARRALSADHPFAGSDALTTGEAPGHPEPVHPEPTSGTTPFVRPAAAIAAPVTGPIIAELVVDDLAETEAPAVEPAEAHTETATGSVAGDEPHLVEELMVVDEPGAPEPTAAEDDEFAEIDDTQAPDAVHIITIDENPQAPVLAPLFQAPPPEREIVQADASKGSFDDLIGSRGVGSSNIASTSALVLPSIPTYGDVGTALDETGEVIITGSIDLPMSLGSTGAAPADGLESADLDAYLDPDGDVGSDVAPVSATRAVSTHGATSGLVAPPKRGSATAPVVLAVTAGVLAIGVVGLLLAAFVFRIF